MMKRFLMPRYSRHILNKFKSGLVRARGQLVNSMITLGLRCDWPILVAMGWRFAMRPMRKVKAKSCGRKKLVVLSKSGGVEDVQNAYATSSARYAVLSLPRWVVKRSGEFWLENRVSDRDYHSNDTTLETLKRRYRAHLIQVLIWFQRLFGLSALAQFNVVYWAERELAAACVEQGVRFVALHKECGWSPELIDTKVKFYSHSVGSFQGSAVSVYNLVSKKIFSAAGIVDEDRVYVPGCARLDESHQRRGNSKLPETRTVLFYLIQANAGLSQFRDEDTGECPRGALASGGSVIDWSKMVKKVNAAVMHLATTNPDVQFICKGKTGFSDHQLKQLKEAAGGSFEANNVKLIAGGIGHGLLENVSVVIGFNTTAVLEAVAAGVPVIVPNIFSEREKDIAGYAYQVNEGVLVPTSTENLKSMVLDVLEAGQKYKELTQGQKNVLTRQLGNSDGKAGARLRAFLDKAVYNEL
jgi:hypothetical protein